MGQGKAAEWSGSSSALVPVPLAGLGDETILGVEPCPFLCHRYCVRAPSLETKTNCKSGEDGKSISLWLVFVCLLFLNSCVCVCVRERRIPSLL